MDIERARSYLLGLPHVVETMQWGDNLVYWVGDKAIGGKMFALLDLEASSGFVASFAAGPERAAELLETEGFQPAPYLARAHWVAAERWDVVPLRRWEQELQSAHGVVSGKLPRRTRQVLNLPARELAQLIAQRREELAGAAARQESLASKKPKKAAKPKSTA